MDLHKTLIMNRATIEYLNNLIVCMCSLYMISCNAHVYGRGQYKNKAKSIFVILRKKAKTDFFRKTVSHVRNYLTSKVMIALILQQ